jgi:hypothetical protein
MKKTLIALIILFSTSVIAQKVEFKEVKGTGNFSVLIPDYMVADETLNESASLQYSCAAKEMYIIVIVDSKKELADAGSNYTLQSYYDFSAKNILSMVENSNKETAKKSKVNGNAALLGTITGQFNGYDIFYRLCIVESKDNFYQVLSWTLASNKKTYGKDIDKMLKSLKEL